MCIVIQHWIRVDHFPSESNWINLATPTLVTFDFSVFRDFSAGLADFFSPPERFRTLLHSKVALCWSSCKVGVNVAQFLIHLVCKGHHFRNRTMRYYTVIPLLPRSGEHYETLHLGIGSMSLHFFVSSWTYTILVSLVLSQVSKLFTSQGGLWRLWWRPSSSFSWSLSQTLQPLQSAHSLHPGLASGCLKSCRQQYSIQTVASCNQKNYLVKRGLSKPVTFQVGDFPTFPSKIGAQSRRTWTA